MKILPSVDLRSSEFRRRLFGLDEAHDKMVPLLAQWGEWFFRAAAHNDRSQGHQIILIGGVGTAKTHVMKRLFQQLSVWGVEMSLTPRWCGTFPTAIFFDWPQSAEEEKEKDFESFFREVRESKIVFMDDVGAESDRYRSGEGTSRLRRVLGECESKWLMISTNLRKSEWGKVYDSRVADRLSAARVFDMGGAPSYRPKLSGGRIAMKNRK